MNVLLSCYSFILNFHSYLAVPSVIIFLSVAIILTIKMGFPQFRAFSRFKELLKNGVKEQYNSKVNSISPMQALFTSLSTTIGIGNIVGPSIAISLGGPGALFWLIIYIFLGSVTKLVEVTFAVYSRKVSQNGNIVGGPTQYLSMISPYLGKWYAILTIFLFTIWSSIQVNTISCIGYTEGIPKWITGLVAVLILLFVLLGGVKRISSILSKLVPFLFIIYFVFALFILFKDINALINAFKSILLCAFSSNSICGGILGISFFNALKEGTYKGIFITESGLGTSSIAHALSDVERSVDQGILAMYSSFTNIVLCLLSGLITLVTGVWSSNEITNTLVYQAFKMHSPSFVIQVILIMSLFLFVITSLIGNTFNGGQSFAAVTNDKYMKVYYIIASIVAFSGALAKMTFLWNLMDVVLAFVAILNLTGLMILAFKHSDVLKI